MTAIEELSQRRRLGKPGPRLPEPERPTNFDEAFALQLAVAKHYSQIDPSDFAGWKCGTPNNGNTIVAGLFAHEQQTAQGSEPFQCMIHPNDDGNASIEPELAFELAADLPPREQAYSEAEVDAAIGATRIAFELIQSRYQQPSDATFLEIFADGLVNQGLWLGPEISPSEDIEHRQIQLSFAAQGETTIERLGEHPNGRARAGLYWLANFLSQQGIGLKRGQQIITGSYAGVLKLSMNKPYRVCYQGLGEFDIQFVKK